jgi:hypothetical protein
MSNTPLFKCRACGLSVDPKSTSTVRKVTAWLRGSGKSIYRVVDEHHEFVHDFCVDYNTAAQQEALFD